MTPARRWLRLAVAGGNQRRAVRVAVVVGILLTLINQGDRLLAGEGVSLVKVVLTFIVPWGVSTWTSVQLLAERERSA